MDLSLVFVAAVAGFVGWKMAARRRSPQQLQAIQQALDAGGVLVDVRTPREFSTGHLPGARTSRGGHWRGGIEQRRPIGRSFSTARAAPARGWRHAP